MIEKCKNCGEEIVPREVKIHSHFPPAPYEHKKNKEVVCQKDGKAMTERKGKYYCHAEPEDDIEEIKTLHPSQTSYSYVNGCSSPFWS